MNNITTNPKDTPLGKSFENMPRMAAIALAKHFKQNDELLEISWQTDMPLLALNETPPRIGLGWGDYAGLYFWTEYSTEAETNQIIPNDRIDTLTLDQWFEHLEKWTLGGTNFRILTHEHLTILERHRDRFNLTKHDLYTTPDRIPEPLFYSKLEISPCTEDENNGVAVCHPSEAQFYSIYGRIADWHEHSGQAICLKEPDSPTLESAIKLAHKLETQYPHLTENGAWEFKFKERTII